MHKGRESHVWTCARSGGPARDSHRSQESGTPEYTRGHETGPEGRRPFRGPACSLSQKEPGALACDHDS